MCSLFGTWIQSFFKRIQDYLINNRFNVRQIFSEYVMAKIFKGILPGKIMSLLLHKEAWKQFAAFEQKAFRDLRLLQLQGAGPVIQAWFQGQYLAWLDWAKSVLRSAIVSGASMNSTHLQRWGQKWKGSNWWRDQVQWKISKYVWHKSYTLGHCLQPLANYDLDKLGSAL